MFGDSKRTNKTSDKKKGKLGGSLIIITKYLCFNKCCIFLWKVNCGGKCGRSRGCQSLKIYHNLRWQNMTRVWNCSFSLLQSSFHHYQLPFMTHDALLRLGFSNVRKLSLHLLFETSKESMASSFRTLDGCVPLTFKWLMLMSQNTAVQKYVSLSV